MRVYVMRGIPGSGKTMWTAKYTKDALLRGEQVVVCSADHYHTNDRGNYVWKPEKVQDAHNACFGKFFDIVRSPLSQPHTLIVDNTNIHAWEVAPYYRMAEFFLHHVEIVRVNIDPMIAAQRNVHGVPARKVFEMYSSLMLERLPSHWNESHVFGGVS